MLVEDCDAPERRDGVERFRAERGVDEPLEPTDRAACGLAETGLNRVPLLRDRDRARPAGGTSAQRVVEIGALRGETTVKLLEPARARGRAPRDRPGAAVRSRPSTSGASPAGTCSTATSATTCCRRCPPMDAALIDGDHNWYTVYHELKMLARDRARGRRAAAGAAPARRRLALRPPRPLLRARAHPRGVPPAVRRSGACARRRRSCAATAASTPPCNAVPRAVPRNGVMTALDDFIAEHDRPCAGRGPADLLRPGDRGRARQRLAERPGAGRGARPARGRRGPASSWLELAESVRIQAS